MVYIEIYFRYNQTIIRFKPRVVMVQLYQTVTHGTRLPMKRIPYRHTQSERTLNAGLSKPESPRAIIQPIAQKNPIIVQQKGEGPILAPKTRTSRVRYKSEG